MYRSLSTLLIAVAAGSSFAAPPGVVPITEPTKITIPGHYVLARNITVPMGERKEPVIRIEASHVTFDMNSHTIRSPCCTGAHGVIALAADVHGVVIHDGFIVGELGVSVPPDSSPSDDNEARLRVERVHISVGKGTGIKSAGGRVEIIDCDIDSGDGRGIELSDARGARVVNNHIVTDEVGIRLVNIVGSEIAGNSINDAEAALLLSGNGGGNVLRENILHNTETGIHVSASNNLLIDNVVFQAYSDGIRITGDGNRVVGNVVGRNSSGIAVGGAFNILEQNQAESNSGCGIYFLNDNGHAYRDNMLRGNDDGAVCGPANTDAGGNIE